MKINLQGLILNLSSSGRRTFDGLIVDVNNEPLDATHSLDHLILEYAKVRLGGESKIVVVSPDIAKSSRYPLNALRILADNLSSNEASNGQ